MKGVVVMFYKPPKWHYYEKSCDITQLSTELNMDPVIVQILINRGINTMSGINKFLSSTPQYNNPLGMKGINQACCLLIDNIVSNKKIRICSDYDVDGVCSGYILLKGFYILWNKIGSGQPLLDIDIPHRIRDGYGLNTRMIEQANNDHVDTIITCDNGISSYAAIELAKKYGMTVIVTDHHEVPYIAKDNKKEYQLPPADVIIDPHQEGDLYPFKGLCGAGVAYKLIERLFFMRGINISEHTDFMELLGLATCCDVMDLVDENRFFVQQSLSLLRNSRIAGIRALLNILEKETISTYDLGFVIGPTLNSAGRLKSAKDTIDFLFEKDDAVALKKAETLTAINCERKEMSERGTAELIQAICSGKSEASLHDKILVCYAPNTHESVAGIIASRLKEYFSRPVLVFTDSGNGILKGSGRSISTYNMYDSLIMHKNLFEKIGGHAMAAGFSIKKENLDLIRITLNQETTLSHLDIEPHILIDQNIELEHITEQFIRDLVKLEPFGKGNRKPIFSTTNVSVSKFVLSGKNKNVLKFEASNGTQNISCISFSGSEIAEMIEQQKGKPLSADEFFSSSYNADIVYFPQLNNYKGNNVIQLLIEDIRIK